MPKLTFFLQSTASGAKGNYSHFQFYVRSNYLSTCDVLNGSATGYLRLNSNLGGEDVFIYHQINVENIKKLIRNRSFNNFDGNRSPNKAAKF